MSQIHRDYFNAMAPNWEARIASDRDLRPLLERFGVGPGDHIMDLGCGTGRTTRLLRQMVAPGGHLYAVDLAEAMLRQGRSLLASKAVSWVCADGLLCPFKTGRMDKVLLFSAFPHFLSSDALLAEIHRVLRPGGGRLLVLHTANHDALNAFHRGLQGPVSEDQLPPAVVLAAELVQAGFHTLTVEETQDLYWVEARTP